MHHFKKLKAQGNFFLQVLLLCVVGRPLHCISAILCRSGGDTALSSMKGKSDLEILSVIPDNET